MKRRAVLAGMGAALSGLAGCTEIVNSGPSCDPDEYDVGMTMNEFVPEELTVEVGDTVRWINDSREGHTVSAFDDSQPDGAEYFASGGFDSLEEAREGWDDQEGLMYTCDTFEHTFHTPGAHHYVCLPHEAAGMVGTIYVEE